MKTKTFKHSGNTKKREKDDTYLALDIKVYLGLNFNLKKESVFCILNSWNQTRITLNDIVILESDKIQPIVCVFSVNDVRKFDFYNM